MKKRIQSVKGEAVLNRLRIVLKESGMSGRQFAEKIGLKAESATRLFNGVTGLTNPLAYSIELHFGLRSKWLLTGEGLKITKHNKQGKMENESFERLINAVERCTQEMQIFNRIFNSELKEAEMRVTETINRKAQEVMDDQTLPELFTRGLQEQLRRKVTIN